MSHRLERGEIYQRILEQCTPYRPQGLWAKLWRECDLWELPQIDRIMPALTEKFGRAALIEAGLAVEDQPYEDNQRWPKHGMGDTHVCTILCPLRKEEGGPPYDLVTVDGGLSGRLPVCAALEDITTQRAIKSAGAMLAVFSLEDLAVLRLASLPAMLASGLGSLSRSTLDEFCCAYGVSYEDGRPRCATGRKGKPASHGATGGRSETAATRGSARVSGLPSPRPLIVVGWSPAGLTADKPDGYDPLMSHLGCLAEHLRLNLDNVHVWEPSGEEITRIAFCVKHGGRRSDLREALEDSLDDSTRLLTHDKPKDLAAAIARLQPLISEGRTDGDVTARRWQVFQQMLQRELVQPLTDQALASKEPREKSRLLAVAGISQLVHPLALAIAAQVAQSSKQANPGQLGPLPEKSLEQFLRLSDRLVALTKERLA